MSKKALTDREVDLIFDAIMDINTDEFLEELDREFGFENLPPPSPEFTERMHKLFQEISSDYRPPEHLIGEKLNDECALPTYGPEIGPAPEKPDENGQNQKLRAQKENPQIFTQIQIIPQVRACCSQCGSSGGECDTAGGGH